MASKSIKKLTKPNIRLKLSPNKNHGDKRKYDRNYDKKINRLGQDLNLEDTPPGSSANPRGNDDP